MATRLARLFPIRKLTNQPKPHILRTMSTTAPKEAPEGYELLSEGKASILFPEENKVFYNRVQNVNRDLSTLVLDTFAKQIENEAEDSFHKRRAKQSWRKRVPTWDTWGRQVEDTDAKVAEENGKGDVAYTRPNGLFMLEALSASGLRSIRYWKEITSGVGVDRILVNDLEEDAVATIKKNVEFNGIDPTKECVPNQGDAAMVMYGHRSQESNAQAFVPDKSKPVDHVTMPFDVVDLDPYGSPVPFLDSAVQCVSDGGMLIVTATDLAVLCGGNAAVCFSKYGSMPVKKGKYHHEMALRMLISCVESHANRYNRYVVPLLSVRLDFYVRIFLRVYTSKEEIKKASLKKAYVIQSKGCDSFHLQPLGEDHKTKVTPGRGPSVGEKCPDTGHDWSIGGPIWSHPIHNSAFVKSLLNRLENKDANGDEVARGLHYANRIQGVLLSVDEELKDVPLHYHVPSICAVLHCSNPPLIKIYAALHNAGYRASQAHVNAEALKTDAPPSVIWDIMRSWIKNEQPVAESAMEKMKAANAAGFKILSKEPTLIADFTIPPEVKKAFATKKANAARFSQNPEEHWGPKARAQGKHKLQTHRKGGNKKARNEGGEEGAAE